MGHAWESMRPCRDRLGALKVGSQPLVPTLCELPALRGATSKRETHCSGPRWLAQHPDVCCSKPVGDLNADSVSNAVAASVALALSRTPRRRSVHRRYSTSGRCLITILFSSQSRQVAADLIADAKAALANYEPAKAAPLVGLAEYILGRQN